jgi:hypothetical protein
VRVAARDDAAATLAAVKRACLERPGGVPLFLHVLVGAVEVVVRARACSVDAGPELVESLEGLLGAGTVLIDR